MVILTASVLFLAIAAGSSTVLTSLSHSRLSRLHSTDHEARAQLEAQVGSHKASVAFLRLIGMVGVASMSVLLASDLSNDNWWLVSSAALGVMLLIAPVTALARSFAARRVETFSRLALGPLAVARFLVRPLAGLPFTDESAISRTTNGAAPLTSLAAVDTLRDLVESDDQPGEQVAEEEKMIRAIVDLKDKAVKEVMVPRPDMAAISADATLHDAARLIVESTHSRLPLYEGNMDNIIGVVYARDVLRSISEPEHELTLADIARAPFFVPETKKAEELLREFLAQSIHFALVVDEYGGIEGVVTLEDLLEEIVGEIEQEHEVPEAPINLITDGEAIVEGQAPLDDLNEALGTDLQGEGFETVGGFVLHHLGRVPDPGDHLDFGGLRFEVLSTMGRRVTKLHLRKSDSADPAEQPQAG